MRDFVAAHLHCALKFDYIYLLTSNDGGQYPSRVLGLGWGRCRDCREQDMGCLKFDYRVKFRIPNSIRLLYTLADQF